jgi:hypothetical protein
VPSTDAVIPDGAIVNVNHNLTLNNLSLHGFLRPPDLDHPVTFTIQNLDWFNGGFVAAHVVIPPGGTANLHPGPTFRISFGDLVNHGTMYWTAASEIFGTLTNETDGTFNFAGDGEVGDHSLGGMIFTNRGTIVKTAGTNALDLQTWDQFTNSGTITSNPGAGTILVGGNLQNGTVINGGDGTSPFDGVQFIGGTVNGTITVHGRLIRTGNSATGTATIQGDGLLDWRDGGFPDDPATTAVTIAPGFRAVFTGSGGNSIPVGNLINNGALEWDGPGQLGGTLTNNGTFTLADPVDGATLSNQFLGLSVTNNGLIRKTAPGTTHLGSVILENKSTIDAGPGFLSLDSLTDALLDGSVLNGHIGGFFGGTFGGDVHINGVFDVEGAQNNGGDPIVATLHGPGSVNWHGGSFASAIVPSQITFAPDLTVNVSGDTGKLISGVLTNRGTINWLGGAPIAAGSQPNGFTNAPGGSLNAKAAGAFLNLGGPFVNAGTVNTFPGGTSLIQGGGTFQNDGALNVGGPGTVGVLEFDTNGNVYVQSAAGRTNLDVTGADPSQFDRILAYHVQLGGALELHPAGPGALGVSAPLQVLTYNPTFGGRNDPGGNPTAFAAVNGGTPTYEDLDLLVGFVPAAPPHDNVADAQVISGPSGSVSGDDVKATYENPFLFPGQAEPAIGGRGGGKSVWYQWTAPRDGIVQFDTHGSNFDTLLSVFTLDPVTGCGQCPPFDFHQVGKSDDTSGGDPTSQINLSVQKDKTYTLGVDSLNGSGGFIALNWAMGLEVQPGPVAQTITSLSTVFDPYTVLVFSPENNTPLTLTVNGTGFTPESRVLLTRALLGDVPTAYVSPTQLVATIPAAYLKAPHVDPPIWVEVLTGNQVTDSYGLLVEEYAVANAPGGGTASASTPKKQGFKLQSVGSVSVQNSDPQNVSFWELADQALLDYARTGEQAYLAKYGTYLAVAIAIDITSAGPPQPATQATVAVSVPSNALPPAIRATTELGLGLPKLAVLVSHDGGSLISQDGAGIISKDGAGVISHDGGGLVGNAGGTFAGGGRLLPLDALQPLGATPLQDPPVGAGWHVVRGSGGHLPTVTNAADPDTGEPVGTINVTLDNTSTPKATELDGQMFFVVLPKYGDVNGDGSVDISDAVAELQVIVGLTAFDELQTLNGDLSPVPGAGVNEGAPFGDGVIDVTDVIRLLRRIVGLEPDPFP